LLYASGAASARIDRASGRLHRCEGREIVAASRLGPAHGLLAEQGFVGVSGRPYEATSVRNMLAA
jgi:hypothetical protein